MPSHIVNLQVEVRLLMFKKQLAGFIPVLCKVWLCARAHVQQLLVHDLKGDTLHVLTFVLGRGSAQASTLLADTCHQRAEHLAPTCLENLPILCSCCECEALCQYQQQQQVDHLAC